MFDSHVQDVLILPLGTKYDFLSFQILMIKYEG